MDDISEIKDNKELLKLSFHNNDIISYNSLRILVRKPELLINSIYADVNYLIDSVLKERHKGKCRLLLTLILRHKFEKNNLRTDFLNYCIDGISTDAYPCSVRVLCIKLAYEQCKFYTELTEELKSVLHLIEIGNMSPGLMTARQNVLKKIE